MCKIALMGFFALATCLLGVSCGGGKARSKIKSDLVGKWEDQMKLIGGQGMAFLRIHLKEDSTFTMDVEAGERAHVLNPYPLFDRIRFQGSWSVQHDGEILLNGKIEEFARTIMTGQAASQGFLHDDKAEKIQTHYTPVPFERPIILRKFENETLFLSSIEFRGNEPGSKSSYPTSQMITGVNFKKRPNDRGN